MSFGLPERVGGAGELSLHVPPASNGWGLETGPLSATMIIAAIDAGGSESE